MKAREVFAQTPISAKLVRLREAERAVIETAHAISWEELIDGYWIVGPHAGKRLQSALERRREILEHANKGEGE